MRGRGEEGGKDGRDREVRQIGLGRHPFDAVALIDRGPVHEPPGCGLRPLLAAPTFRIFAVRRRVGAAGRGKPALT